MYTILIYCFLLKIWELIGSQDINEPGRKLITKYKIWKSGDLQILFCCFPKKIY